MHLTKPTTNKRSFITKLLTTPDAATNHANYFSMGTNNGAKTSNAKNTSNAGETGNIEGCNGRNAVDSALGRNKGLEKAKKNTNIMLIALTH